MTVTSASARQTASKYKYYPPSILDRFMDFIQRLPIPYWLTYLLLFLLQSLLMHLIGWNLGWPAPYKSNPLIFMFPIWQWLPFAIMTHADSVALQALDTFRPLLNTDEAGLDRLKYEFSTMPSRGLLLNSLLWGIAYAVLIFAAYKPIVAFSGLTESMGIVTTIEGLICYLTGSAIYYHSLRQLRLVNRTVRMARHFNVFQLEPVYAFSRVTSLTGISWMVMLTATLLTFPIQFISGLVIVILAIQLALAVAAFVLPLWSVHRRIVSEKLRLQSELNRQVESAMTRLHHLLEANDMPPVTQFKDAMLALESERKVLDGIPTWPWNAGTLTGFISATILPILLFIIQLVIQKVMGG